jgi:hypothetical protein
MALEVRHVRDPERPHVPDRVLVEEGQHLLEPALIPELKSAPGQIGVRVLEHRENPMALLRSSLADL